MTLGPGGASGFCGGFHGSAFIHCRTIEPQVGAFSPTARTRKVVPRIIGFGTLLSSPSHRMSWLQRAKIEIKKGLQTNFRRAPQSEKRLRSTGRKDHGWPVRRCHLACPRSVPTPTPRRDRVPRNESARTATDFL